MTDNAFTGNCPTCGQTALEARLAEAVWLLKGWSAYQASQQLMAETRAFIRAADNLNPETRHD